MDRRLCTLIGLLSITAFGCQTGDPKGKGSSLGEPEGWAVTAWGERWEEQP
jgi:hypothetical protein